MSSLVEEYKVTKTRAETTLTELKDNMVSQAGITMNTGGKWDVSEAVSQEIRKTEEGQKYTKAVIMLSQEVLPKKIAWSELCKMEPLRIKLCFRAVYDMLPTSTNLVKWGTTENPNCKLCSLQLQCSSDSREIHLST